jgi:ribosomal protein S18 acetylase RimI-like enzyme
VSEAAIDMNAIVYRLGNNLNLDQVIELYHASTLSERRPVEDRGAMAAMLENASLVVTAWDGERLVGLARTLSDFLYVGYLSDLAVHAEYQRQGIGKELIAQTRRYMGPKAKLVLIAAPRAVEYYPRIGFSKVESAWMLGADAPFPR